MRWIAATTLSLLAAGCAGGDVPPAGPSVPGAVDFAREGRETVQLLRELIRFDTINPPQPDSKKANADETALLRRVKEVLAAEGVASEILESAPGRGNLVARYRGTGEKKPLLLLAHVDVVNVDRTQWEVDPVSAAIKDGRIWGRGALDDKDDAAVFTQVMRILARTKPRLARDVILLLTADEESSARYGAQWVIERHWNKIACEFVINEGGRATLRSGRLAQYGFGTAEKVYNDIRLWVRRRSGHSSVPLPKNAIYDAARLLERLERLRMPVRLNETTRAYFAGLAPTAPEKERDAMRRAGEGDLGAAEQLCEVPRYNALLRTTFVPTIVRGGIRENILPPEVEINFNVRLLPGEKLDDLLKAILAHLGMPDGEVVEGDAAAIEQWKRAKKVDEAAAIFVMDRSVDGGVSSLDTDLFRALVRAAKKLTPEALALPAMSTGTTDSRFFRLKGVQCYGISPCPADEDEEKTVHQHNERVRVESVEFGVRFVLEVVLDVAR